MKAVVFDFGGVLFQWQPLQLLQQCVPELATNDLAAKALAAQIFESFTPDSDWARFDLGRIEEAELADRIAARVGIRAEQVRRVIDAIPAHLTHKADTVQLLRLLQAAGHRLFYLSNMPQPYALHLERENDFVGAFQDGIFSARVGLMKPDAAIFDLAVQRFELDPAQTLFIDDHPGNISAAQALGWQAVHFVDATQCAKALQANSWL